ncbi:BlaI/MecI/CopY family transcriptional regulator [Solimicrobium silvestre]|uniref:Putative transcriptional regulator n=1 Tax=Solimicrobium silvestre TaxID=2099400 RepID=A0A2S9H1B9_9BURK|nr:BlaI/MecI/CopY family transcriptional regulator [Solimicrobium silvestre]PRC93784.1 putative transcriptional regulator [Solimicrobium silvestre]
MTKNIPIPKPTTVEMNVLRLVWQLGPSTAKQVLQEAVKERPEITYATILRVLQIMHSKGLLIRDESQRSHIYAPAQPQDALQSNLVKDLIQKVFAGSGKALVMEALRTHVSKKERDEIEALLREDKK